MIVKKITLPVMTEAELRDSIYWEAEQYIPFDIQDVNLDYQILDPGTGPDSRGSMDVLLVAAKKEKIGDYTSVITQAGPHAGGRRRRRLRAAERLRGQLRLRDRTRSWSLLNAGASAININILQGDQSVFTRDISIGGNAYTEAVQKELDLPFEAAEQLKKGIPVDGATFEDAQPVLRAVTENVLLEVQKTFDFFKATASVDHIDPRRAERRRVARRRASARCSQERLQRAGRGLRSVPRRDVGRREAGRRDPATGRVHGGGGRRPRPAAGRRPMIRINLLGVERQKAKSAPAFDVGQQLTAPVRPDARAGRRPASAGGTGRCGRSRAQLDAEIAGRQPRGGAADSRCSPR